MAIKLNITFLFVFTFYFNALCKPIVKMNCFDALGCQHTGVRRCGLEGKTREIRWFLDACDLVEFNCEYKTNNRLDLINKPLQGLDVDFGIILSYIVFELRRGDMASLYLVIVLLLTYLAVVMSHGPPKERDNEDIQMGRKMGAKWCGMAKVCNHDRVPVCGVSHAGDLMGFRDLCDMFDYNCLRRRNYKQTACPEDKSLLVVSRRPTNNYYDD